MSDKVHENTPHSKRPRPSRLPASPFISPARKAGDLIAKPLHDALGQRGFAGPEIIARWGDIVGADLAAFTVPEKIVWPRRDAPTQRGSGDWRGQAAQAGATLHIRADGPGALEVQHMGDIIIERVNQFLGHAAVSRLRIVQAPVARPIDKIGKAVKAKPQDGGTAAAKPPIRIEGIADPALAMALARLGSAIRRAGG